MARSALASVAAAPILPIALIAVVAAALPRATSAAGGAALEVAVERDNCPVYSTPAFDDTKIVYTVHKASRHAAVEPGRAGERRPFHRIRFGSRDSDVGWVSGDCAQLVAARTRETTTAAPAGPDLALLERIRRLVQIYNDERSELTRSYNLRPFPAFGVALAQAQAGELYLPDRRVRVPLTYASASRKFSLPRADKLLLQLVVREAFQTTPSPAAVDIELTFSAGAPVRLTYLRGDWQQLGQSGLDDFWRGVTGAEKGAL